MTRAACSRVDAAWSLLHAACVIELEPNPPGVHDPRCDFDEHAFTIRGPTQIGDLTGTALFCKRPLCSSRLVLFAGHLTASPGEADGSDGVPVGFSIELDSGYVLANKVEGSGGEVEERVAARVERSREWLGSNLPGTLLDLFHRRLVEAKGQKLDPAAWRKRDLSWWRPGTVVAWREVEPDGRVDLYVAGERCYRAFDYYCANPGCDCTEVSVVFFAPDAERSELQKVGTVIFSRPDGPRSITELGPGVTEGQVAELGDLFLQRHGSERLAERQRRVRHEVGVEIVRRHFGPSGASSATVVGRPPRPNEPCPCGSGKKYKKCCRDVSA